ncbi:MAG: hypothetical protein R3C18_13920 [Planctomycetaceae bacterium]
MDPNQAWNNMLRAYATKQWQEALEASEVLKDWLDDGGFPPQPTIGTTAGDLTCQLDPTFNQAICLAATHQIFENSLIAFGDEG